MAAILEAKAIEKRYRSASQPILADLSLYCSKGEMVGIFGESGAGKSTLLHILGGLDRPDSGCVRFEGNAIYEWSESHLAEYRNRSVGFVFQFFHLLPEFSALENVMMPMLIASQPVGSCRERALRLLGEVGLQDQTSHFPSQLSGGEQQRVAMARALMMKPALLLADEPTGNLDHRNGVELFKLLLKLSRKYQMGIVLVTHNPDLLQAMDRRYHLTQGRLHEH